MAESKKVVLVGIPGVGKTTLVSRIVDILEGHQKTVRVVSFGTVMMEEAKKDGIEGRDDLRKLPISRQQDLQKKAGQSIAAMTEDIVVVDTHAFISTHAGFYPGLPDHVLRIIRPANFVSVSAKPEEIYSRRIRDKSRDRDIVTIDTIKKELAVQDAMVAACSVLSGSPMKSVLNSEGNADSVAQQIAEVVGA